MIAFALIAALLAPQASDAAPQSRPPHLNCERGPARHTYGGTPWLIYGCDDDFSLVFVTDQGSPAFPFVFILYVKAGEYALSGEGTGDRTVTDRAYADLTRLGESDIKALLNETRALAAR